MVFVTNEPSALTGVNKSSAYLERENDATLNINGPDGEQLSIIGLPDRLDQLQSELYDTLKLALNKALPSGAGALRSKETCMTTNHTHVPGEDCSKCQNKSCPENLLLPPEPLVGNSEEPLPPYDAPLMPTGVPIRSPDKDSILPSSYATKQQEEHEDAPTADEILRPFLEPLTRRS